MMADIGTARHLTEVLGLADRRHITDRRFGERRDHAVPVTVERRHGDRRYLQRRETAAGHIRNALQTLDDLVLLHGPGTPEHQDVTTALRRLWLSLREIELGNAGRHPVP
ncbi:MAG: hypothetical protein ACREMV_06155 [Gemmatimonadales bacterium]